MNNVFFIATGDELTTGDVLNTNGQKMAKSLHELGFEIPMHIVVDDQQAHIESALTFALEQADMIILTGGLGPTSDDRTRFALSAAIAKPLIEFTDIWQAICERIKIFDIELSDNNRQQALFPEDAEILPNPHGTAAGCMVRHNDTLIFMLPGPPRECLPMFTQYVLPKLQPYACPKASKRWLLLGASEGDIAPKLDAAAGADVTTGYRWDYPYIEFKLFAQTDEQIEQATQRCLPLLRPYYLNKFHDNASTVLLKHLQQHSITLKIEHNTLAELLLAEFPELDHYLHPTSDTSIHLSGFKEYGQTTVLPCKSSIELTIITANGQTHYPSSLYYRDDRIGLYLKEWVSKMLLFFFDAL